MDVLVWILGKLVGYWQIYSFYIRVGLFSFAVLLCGCLLFTSSMLSIVVLCFVNKVFSNLWSNRMNCRDFCSTNSTSGTILIVIIWLAKYSIRKDWLQFYIKNKFDISASLPILGPCGMHIPILDPSELILWAPPSVYGLAGTSGIVDLIGLAAFLSDCNVPQSLFPCLWVS